MPSRRIRRTIAACAAAVAALAVPSVAWPAHDAGGSAGMTVPAAGAYPQLPKVTNTALAPAPGTTTIRACHAHRIRVAKRTFLPVACEQPPKSNLGLQLQQRTANLAALLNS